MNGKVAETPIACSLSSTQQRAEIDRLKKRLAPHIVARTYLKDGVQLTLTPVPGLTHEIQRIIELDRKCCEFLNHKMEQEGNKITWTVTSEGAGVQLAQNFSLELAPTLKNNYRKAAAIIAICGFACAAPFAIGAVGLSAATIGLSTIGIEIAALGLIMGIGAGFWLYKRGRNHAAKGEKNANRCSC